MVMLFVAVLMTVGVRSVDAQVVMKFEDGGNEAIVYDNETQIACFTQDLFGNMLISSGTVPDGEVHCADEEETGVFLFKNNLPNGISRTFYKNGNIHIETYYADGRIQDIVREYYEDGGIQFETSIIDGVPEGACTQYYRNGTVHVVENIVAGEKHGTAKHYFEDGSLEAELEWVYGECTWVKTYDADGTLKEEGVPDFSDGQTQFIQSKGYDDDGNIIRDVREEEK